jgi:ankyrin repeat protein
VGRQTVASCRSRCSPRYKPQRDSALLGATSGNVEIVKLLASAGSSLHHNELHWPVFKRNVEMVKLLLEMGCDLDGIFAHHDDEIERGDTPLLVAVRQTAKEFMD